MTYQKPVRFFFILCLIAFAALNAVSAEMPPIGQTKTSPSAPTDGGISADVFGQKGGRYHPFILLEEVYTDNIFSTKSNTKDDFITTVKPGIWLAFPANRERLLKLSTTTTSPGGLNLSRIKPEATRRYQTYFLYSPEFVFYNSFSNHDHINHKAEALFQYNLNSGLSFDLIDLFNDREEIAGNGVADTLYRHQDNLIDFISAYTTRSEKLKIQLTFSNYYLDFKDNAVDYRDRTDNTADIAIFYKFWPKTSLFLEYAYSDISYDSASTLDNVENRFYSGVNWEVTAKTRGTLKLGYIDKDFDSDTRSDQDDFSLELQTQHNFTPKRALQLNGYRKFHESDLSIASSYLSTGIDVGLMQRFTEKWSGTLNGLYEQNKYNGFDRDDNLFGIGPAIRFEAKKWLIFDLGYQFFINDSNLDAYDYKGHLLFLRASLSM
ncbi:MAG: outer membrane beta-barrel protein [Proteobacteria bacterium]|nr:outer membrane beta-barrel protein [Pseudomonadota bacterium]MBU1388054.1 outer membrane beta-barrel protein [Pseudomonadota bacterium]MBU1542117.1 outer membrane beta-barrel protein [Pseudomonadota bacterium]MBU2430101.1 outer membrane beta-barrel protein [Pseudomonadota bacterium]MBU2482381.1 outer membrane beta-barrel protein [Pseudomonadota bacterium]